MYLENYFSKMFKNKTKFMINYLHDISLSNYMQKY